MRLADLYIYPDKTPRQTEIERKLRKMQNEIHRDETESDIDVPLHLRNEYYDDSYESVKDKETESQLLDREVNRVRGKSSNKQRR